MWWENAKYRLYKLIIRIWNEEHLPNQWNEGIIIPIYKKGDRMICGNYRPITLLNIAYKIFASVLNNRLTALTESKLTDCQMGFRPNRSTVDSIFIIRQIFEKCHEYKIDLHNLFIDYTQAFDSVKRNKITDCLRQYNIPNKLVRLIKITLENTTVKVKINNNVSENFEVTVGVKQGDPLSATLFCLVIDSIIKQLDLRGNISSKLKQCTAYADDILITARTKFALTETFMALKDLSIQYGLLINNSKTKYLKCASKDKTLSSLNIDSNNFEQVKSFKYLGAIVNGNNSIEEEVIERIKLGNKAFYANKIFFKSKLVSKAAKFKLYTTVIRPIVTYASESWVIKEVVKQKLLIFERRILRRIFGPIKENGLWRIQTNNELNKLIQNKNIINYIKAQRLGWFGHVNRMSDDRMGKSLYKWKPLNIRAKGRPKNRWEDDVLIDIKLLKVKNWPKSIQDRKEWKKLVEKAKTSTEL